MAPSVGEAGSGGWQLSDLLLGGWRKSEYMPVGQEAPEDIPRHLKHKVHRSTLFPGHGLNFNDVDFDSGDDSSVESVDCRSRWLRGDFTIVPEENKLLDIWDLVVISALVATACLLPFEAAFYTHPPPLLQEVMRATDVIFTLDVIVTFMVAYTVPNAFTQDMYERRPLKIAQNYMAVPFMNGWTAGWFWPDVITLIPWDSLGVVNIRFVRILRLLRMVRLVRVIKLFGRWHSRIGTSYAFLNIVACVWGSMVMLHWLSCVWGCLGIAHCRGRSDHNWLRLYAWDRGEEYDSYGILEVYNLSLYFCVMTLTGVGFGDIAPADHFEVLISTITMFATGFMWAWVIANVVSVVNNLDPFWSMHQKLSDELNAMMEARCLPSELRTRVRKHLHEAYKVHRQRHQQATVKMLSNGLQGEIAIQSGADKVCGCVWYLQDLTSDVVVALVNYFEPEMYSPAECIMHKYALSVIRRGSCLKTGRVLSRDDVVGDDMLLSSDFLRDKAFPRTLNFVEVMTLQRDDLLRVCEHFPDLSRKIRLSQIKLAFRRGVVYFTRQIRVIRALSTPADPRSRPDEDVSCDRKAKRFLSRPAPASLKMAPRFEPNTGPQQQDILFMISDLREALDKKKGSRESFSLLSATWNKPPPPMKQRASRGMEPPSAGNRRRFSMPLIGDLKGPLADLGLDQGSCLEPMSPTATCGSGSRGNSARGDRDEPPWGGAGARPKPAADVTSSLGRIEATTRELSDRIGALAASLDAPADSRGASWRPSGAPQGHRFGEDAAAAASPRDPPPCGADAGAGPAALLEPLLQTFAERIEARLDLLERRLFAGAPAHPEAPAASSGRSAAVAPQHCAASEAASADVASAKEAASQAFRRQSVALEAALAADLASRSAQLRSRLEAMMEALGTTMLDVVKRRGQALQDAVALHMRSSEAPRALAGDRTPPPTSSAASWSCGPRGSAELSLHSMLDRDPHRPSATSSFVRASTGLDQCTASSTWLTAPLTSPSISRGRDGPQLLEVSRPAPSRP